MSLSMSKTVSESVSISDSAKSASIVTDSSSNIWDLANKDIVALLQGGVYGPVLNMANGNQYTLPGVTFAAAQNAFLATRS